MEHDLFLRGNKGWWVVSISLVILGLLIFGVFYLTRDEAKAPNKEENSTTEKQAGTKTLSWKPGGVAIAGKWADSENIELGNGQYRMYYSVEPEVPGNQLEVYSALSTDGIVWEQENGVRKTRATFPDIVRLDDNTYRMYFQNERVIKSAISTDGLNFTDEGGVRIDKTEEGYEGIDGVGGHSTIRMNNDTYMMVYSGTDEDRKYLPNVPNDKTANFFYATSSDGLTWQKQGLAVSSENSTLEGWVDGAELVDFDSSTSLTTGGEIRLYFWSYKGIYHSVYKDGKFGEPIFDYAGENVDKNVMYSPNPPSDPSLMKVGEKWFMYYGQHEKGIYYTTLE